MKYFDWDESKNEELISERDVSFEEIIFAIFSGGLLQIIEHPNQQKYPGQEIFVVNIKEYIYLVPFVEDSKTVFLKTIIPSRKMTKHYLGGKNETK